MGAGGWLTASGIREQDFLNTNWAHYNGLHEFFLESMMNLIAGTIVKSCIAFFRSMLKA